MAYEMINPVREAISTYRDVNDIYRQNRAEERAIEDRDYTRARQAKSDAMAVESHKSGMETAALLRKATQATLDQAEQKKWLDTLQAARFKVSSDLPLDDNEIAALQKDPSLAPYIKDANKRQAYIKAAQDLHMDIPEALGINGPPNRDAYKRVMDHLSVLAENRLTMYGQRPGRVVGIVPGPGGKFFIEGEFERTVPGTPEDPQERVEKYIAPLTKNKSSDPNDEVNAYSIDEVLPKISDNADLLDKLGKQLDAKRIAAGDDEPLKQAVKDKKTAKALDAVTTAIDKLPDGPEKQALSAVLPGVVSEAIPAAVGDTMIKAAVPKEKKPDEWQDWGHGQMRNKRTGDIVKVPVKPDKGGKDGDETAPKGKQAFMTRNNLNSAPMIEYVEIGTPMYDRYMTGDLQQSGKVIPFGKKKQASQLQAYNTLMALNPLTERTTSEVIDEKGSRKVSSVAMKPQAGKLKPRTGDPDLATAQAYIKKYGSKQAAMAAWQRGE